MRVRETYCYLGRPREYDVATATEVACAGESESGIAERAMATACQTAEVLGRLVQALVDSGAIGEDALLQILRYGFEIVPEEGAGK